MPEPISLVTRAILEFCPTLDGRDIHGWGVGAVRIDGSARECVAIYARTVIRGREVLEQWREFREAHREFADVPLIYTVDPETLHAL